MATFDPKAESPTGWIAVMIGIDGNEWATSQGDEYEEVLAAAKQDIEEFGDELESVAMVPFNRFLNIMGTANSALSADAAGIYLSPNYDLWGEYYTWVNPRRPAYMEEKLIAEGLSYEDAKRIEGRS